MHGIAGKFVHFVGLPISSESMCRGSTLHCGGPHLTGESAGNASLPSFRGLHLTGVFTCYASSPSFRWALTRRDVDGVCLTASISMGSTSPGFRRVMPRHSHFDGLHLGGMSTGYLAAWEGRGGRRCPHWVQMIEPLIFGVGAEGGHIGSK